MSEKEHIKIIIYKTRKPTLISLRSVTLTINIIFVDCHLYFSWSNYTKTKYNYIKRKYLFLESILIAE